MRLTVVLPLGLGGLVGGREGSPVTLRDQREQREASRGAPHVRVEARVKGGDVRVVLYDLRSLPAALDKRFRREHLAGCVSVCLDVQRAKDGGLIALCDCADLMEKFRRRQRD